MSGTVIDPSIPLQIRPPGNMAQGALTQAAGVGQAIGGLSSGISSLQRLRATQAAGQILASAPSLAEGIKALQSNPETAAWGLPLINEASAIRQTLTNTTGARLGQANSALQMLFHNAGEAIKDPSSFSDVEAQTLEALPPELRSRMRPAFDALRKSLTDGLPSDPAAASEAFRDRLANQFMSNGGTQAQLAGILGATGLTSSGGALVPTQINPPQEGPGVRVGPGGIPLTLPPQITSVSGVPQAVGGAYTGQLSGTPQAGIVGARAGTGAAGASGAGVAWDGIPLAAGITQDHRTMSNLVPGLPLYTPAEAERNKLSMDEFEHTDTPLYKGAQGALYSLGIIERDLNQISRSGSFVEPGSWGAVRLDLAKNLNTIAQLASGGKASPIDPSSIASAESVVKETTRLGAQVSRQYFGSQEAWQTISSMTQTVPGLENTPLGARLLTKSLEGLTQRAIDLYEFKSGPWAKTHYGTMTGANAAFNKVHPVSGYIDKVFSSMGLEQGTFKWKNPQTHKTELQPKFTSPQSVVQNYQNGYITGGQMNDYLHAQFPNATPQQIQQALSPGQP